MSRVLYLKCVRSSGTGKCASASARYHCRHVTNHGLGPAWLLTAAFVSFVIVLNNIIRRRSVRLFVLSSCVVIAAALNDAVRVAVAAKRGIPTFVLPTYAHKMCDRKPSCGRCCQTAVPLRACRVFPTRKNKRIAVDDTAAVKLKSCPFKVASNLRAFLLMSFFRNRSGSQDTDSFRQ